MNQLPPSSNDSNNFLWTVFTHFTKKTSQAILSKIETIKNSFTYTSTESSMNPIYLNLLDPTIPENALKILNLSEEDRKDSSRVDQAYFGLTQSLETKKAKLASLVFVKAMDEIAANIDKAYETIKKMKE